jgi:hypothetical protein
MSFQRDAASKRLADFNTAGFNTRTMTAIDVARLAVHNNPHSAISCIAFAATVQAVADFEAAHPEEFAAISRIAAEMTARDAPVTACCFSCARPNLGRSTDGTLCWYCFDSCPNDKAFTWRFHPFSGLPLNSDEEREKAQDDVKNRRAPSNCDKSHDC